LPAAPWQNDPKALSCRLVRRLPAAFGAGRASGADPAPLPAAVVRRGGFERAGIYRRPGRDFGFVS
jgi:hypothetical protein